MQTHADIRATLISLAPDAASLDGLRWYCATWQARNIQDYDRRDMARMFLDGFKPISEYSAEDCADFLLDFLDGGGVGVGNEDDDDMWNEMRTEAAEFVAAEIADAATR